MFQVNTASLLEDLLKVYSVSYMSKRCVGFMMAKMVLRELMDPFIFANFKSFLMKVERANLVPFYAIQNKTKFW